MKKTTLFITYLLLIFIFTGCSNNASTSKTNPKELVGNWKIVSDNLADQNNFILEDDGTYYAANKIAKGSWYVKNEKLTLCVKQIKNPFRDEYVSGGDPQYTKYTYYLGNNNQTLTLIDDNNNISTYKRYKETEIDFDIPTTDNLPGIWQYTYGNNSDFQGYFVEIKNNKTFTMEKLRGTNLSKSKGTWSTQLKTITFTHTHKQNSNGEWVEIPENEITKNTYQFKSEKNLLILLDEKDETTNTIFTPKDDSDFINPTENSFNGKWYNINNILITYYEFESDGTIFSHSQLIDQYLIGKWKFEDDILSITFDQYAATKDDIYNDLPRDITTTYECLVSDYRLKLIDGNNNETILIKQ